MDGERRARKIEREGDGKTAGGRTTVQRRRSVLDSAANPSIPAA